MLRRRQTLLSRKIEDKTVFIVFDMEWNQPFPGRDYKFDVSSLSGEIIEIGAVKYVYDSGILTEKDIFSCDVRPCKYTTLHYHVKKVTHKTNDDLKSGISFEEAYTKFRKFCGDDFILVGWGNSDPDMLKMNLKFFDMDDQLNCFFLDIQPIFSMFAGERGKQRSVEFAVDHYGIPKNDSFHSATSDARYTGEIFKRIFDCNKTSEVLSVISSSSIDPDLKREYVNVGSETENPLDALSMTEGWTQICPICSSRFREEISRFRIRKSVYALYACDEHGEFFSRTRIKKNKSGKYYAASVLRFATQTDYYLVAAKREEYERFGSKGAPAPAENETAPETQGDPTP